MEEEKRELLELLPEGYEKACIETKALLRRREIREAKTFMELNLLYLVEGLSLMEVSAVAKLSGTQISDVGFMKRFASCVEWFKWIIERLLPPCVHEYQKPEKLKEYRVIAVDASDVKEKGATGRIWRLHYGIDLFTLTSAYHKITTQEIGESLGNFTFQKNDLVLGDRIYGTLTGIEQCFESEAQFILRLRKGSFTLYDENGEKLQLEDRLAALPEKETLDLHATVNCSGPDRRSIKRKLRICAIKKSKEAIEKEGKRIKRLNSKKQERLSAKAAFQRNYIIVATSMPETVSSDEILELYRLRWQVELFFKRLKSLLDFGNLPKRSEKGVNAWLNGKIMVALMIEKALAYEDFSPSKTCRTGNPQFMA